METTGVHRSLLEYVCVCVLRSLSKKYHPKRSREDESRSVSMFLHVYILPLLVSNRFFFQFVCLAACQQHYRKTRMGQERAIKLIQWNRNTMTPYLCLHSRLKHTKLLKLQQLHVRTATTVTRLSLNWKHHHTYNATNSILVRARCEMSDKNFSRNMKEKVWTLCFRGTSRDDEASARQQTHFGCAFRSEKWKHNLSLSASSFISSHLETANVPVFQAQENDSAFRVNICYPDSPVRGRVFYLEQKQNSKLKWTVYHVAPLLASL